MKSPRSSSSRGVALVVVLVCLVLVSVLVVSFLSSVTTELQSSKSYAEHTSVRLLADSAVQIVMGQIKAGTTGRGSMEQVVAWASQPGLIRTFDAAGQPERHFKLYSSGTMTGAGAFPGENVPASWDADPALFSDLNEPLLGRWPILTAAAEGKVQGFSVDETHTAVSGKRNPAPMPVRWLYVLQDGQIAVPSSGSGERADFSASPVQPSGTNPIVGRIAFWTDDETCKVNLNTASEGAFWDTPRVLSTYEKQNLANYQPAQKEFQRYPGHPATTSLSPVLGAWLPVSSNYESLKPYFEIAPRTKDGGSEGGTKIATSPISFSGADNQRLYATVDEMAFDPDRQDLPATGIGLDAEAVDQLRFFLTTCSRAPDVNLFNKPRLGIWPVHETADANHRTIFDRLIAFCGTVGGRPFYFQRKNAGSATEDLPAAAAPSGVGRNRALFNYLRKLGGEEIPGFGGNFAAKYGADRDQIFTEIFDYIRSTNLIDTDNGSATFQPFTPKGVSETTGTPGGGQVVPIHDSVSDSRGFGRFPTVSEAAFIFYATGDHSTDATIPDGQIQVRAVFLPEMFTPALGWVTEYNNFKIRVDGLNGLTWAAIDPSNGSTEAAAPMGFPGGSTYDVRVSTGVTLVRLWGGSKGIRLFHHNKNFGTTASSAAFPNISGPKLFFSGSNSTITPPGTKFYFSGGDVTIRIFDSTGAEELQSIRVHFPSGNFPVPRLTPDGSGLANGGINLRKFSTSTKDDGTASPQPYGRFRYFGASDAASEVKICWVTQWDTVRSVLARDGDIRLIAGKKTITPADNLFTTLPSYSDETATMSHSLVEAGSHPLYGSTRGRLVANAGYFRADTYPSPSTVNTISLSGGVINASSGLRTTTWDMDVPYNGVALGKHGPASGGDLPGDWDNGVGDIKDGPYINKPDEGTQFREGGTAPPYFRPSNYRDVTSATFFSPNRQIPSAVMFGSLPSGVKANKPWQTLHFRPTPEGHPGLASPKDHLLLDFFHMPVVEPYAISEPLSTAGRINMNWQIEPFSYIRRDTGLRAVLAKERILAVPITVAASYKDNGDPPVNPTPGDLRHDLDIDETLKGFEQRFAAGDVFRSASEICDIHLVPAGQTYAGMAAFWDNYPLTGDNSRERPYAHIYPRLTTKSNTFTVHVRAQTLSRPVGRLTGAPLEFDTAKGDRVTGEYRGSTTLERYVDPNEPGLPDFADPALFNDPSTDLDAYYRFRIIGSKKFTP
jgi:uncharacterized protein (TIGR02600 family)